ncbi:ABC transporter permease [Rhodocytophaga rosea]|nr:ABC transporter permease [Rhodocytophaga rosea]
MHETKLPQPPRWAERFLEGIAADHLLEEVQGDLQELFQRRLQKFSIRKARFFYVLDLIKLIHPRLWRNKPSPYPSLNPIDMFQHYLLLSYRNFARFKSSFFINLIGLSTGLACTLLIYLWVRDELQMDTFYEKDEQLYQVLENRESATGLLTFWTTSGPTATSLAEDMPEVQYAATVLGGRERYVEATFSVGEKNIKTKGGYASKDYFQVFSHQFLSGNPSTVLADKNGIVLSETLAKNLFGTTENVVGKSVEFDHDKVFQVSGVYKELPPNSSQHMEFILSFEKFVEENDWAYAWGNTAPFTYVLLKPGTDIGAFNRKIAGYVKTKTENEITHRTMFIKRFSENYLYGKYENGVLVGGRIEYVKLFSIIALFILVIACINFMNLSTAKASRRLKEVGVRKTIGANRLSLVYQYLGESLLMAFLSMLASVILVVLFLPTFNEITGKELSLSLDPVLITSVLALTVFTGIVAGSYPALYLSGFHPIAMLKGKLPTSVGELWIRKGLVVFQFSLSIILIVAVLVVYKQIEFVQNQNLGYKKENLIYINKEGKLLDKSTQETFIEEVKNLPGIVNASTLGHSLTGHNGGTYGIQWEGKDPNDKTEFESVSVNYGTIETLGVDMQEGRSFSREYGADSAKIIFNEAAIKFMNMKDPIGKVIKLWGNDMQIIGIVKDFHFESLHEKVKPLFFRVAPRNTRFIIARISAGKEKEAIDHLQKLYTSYNPGFTFEYKFLDQNFQALYEAEQRVSSLSRYFAALAILISCLGLFGLTAFTAERRRKEIGIRKVLGSSQWGIVYLLSKEFTKMVVMSILIALPMSYLLLSNWLDNFAFKIDLEAWYFLSAGIVALLIAWLTVGTQAVKAARINPIQTLKEE